jgi:hypothetical protein
MRIPLFKVLARGLPLNSLTMQTGIFARRNMSGCMAFLRNQIRTRKVAWIRNIYNTQEKAGSLPIPPIL